MTDKDKEKFDVDGVPSEYYGTDITGDMKNFIESTILSKIKKKKTESYKPERPQFVIKKEKPPRIDPEEVRARQQADALRALNVAVRQAYFGEGALLHFAEKLHHVVTAVLPDLTDMNEIRILVYNSCLDNMLWIIKKMESKISSLSLEEPLPEFENKDLLSLIRDIAQKIKDGNFDSDEWDEEEYKAAVITLDKEINDKLVNAIKSED